MSKCSYSKGRNRQIQRNWTKTRAEPSRENMNSIVPCSASESHGDEIWDEGLGAPVAVPLLADANTAFLLDSHSIQLCLGDVPYSQPFKIPGNFTEYWPHPLSIMHCLLWNLQQWLWPCQTFPSLPGLPFKSRWKLPWSHDSYFLMAEKAVLCG